MKLFDLTFTNSLSLGQRVSRTSWNGEKWLVWPIDLTDPMVLFEVHLTTEGGRLPWDLIDLDADANADDWVVLE